MKLTANMRTAVALGALTVSLRPSPILAEKMDCSGSQRAIRQVSSQAIKPGARPDRELVQFVRVDVLSSKHPEFDGAEQTVYAHLDQLGGTGTETGYTLVLLKSGEKLWSKWEGTHYLVPKGGDAWELAYAGIFRFIAGTGKYQGIRGSGYYRGMATPTGNTGETVCKAEY